MEDVMKKLEALERKIDILQSSLNEFSSTQAQNFTKLDVNVKKEINQAKEEILIAIKGK